MALAIAATVAAAGLVLFLQQRAISALQAQTRIALEQISEQTAADVATELRRILDGPVFDTLTAVNHPELRAGRLDLVAAQFDAGLRAYPHVDQFFAWHTTPQGRGVGSREVMFFARDAQFHRDEVLSGAVMRVARAHAPSQKVYIAAEGEGTPHQLFLRVFWTDATRTNYFAILGFVVTPGRMHERLFGPEGRSAFDTLLARRGDVPLQLTVKDERDRRLFGDAPAGPISGRVEFPMVFYPAADIQSRLAAGVDARRWTIEVTARESNGAMGVAGQARLLTAASLMLMLVALGLTFQAQRRSAELAQMQSDFVAHVSHQLKTPLSLLSAATETLQMDRVRTPERLSDYLTTIHAEAARLSSLVQRVLEFSRVTQHRTYEFERIDLGHLAGETVDAFARGFTNRTFRCAVPGGGGPYVLADPAAMEQVIANLLDNAVKYSAPETPVIVRVYEKGAGAIVDIVDEGIGIARDEQSHIFERFYRASTAAHRQGFGLGLTIVRELLDAHGGRVSVASTPGKGSTFRVTLPVHRQERRHAATLGGDHSEVHHDSRAHPV
jgi:two-component system phosphate regulon sensor histidine kinase PhoR